MQTFGQSNINRLLSVMSYAAGLAVVGFIIRTFVSSNPLWFVGLPVLAWLYTIYSAFWGDNMKIVVTDDGRMQICRCGRILADYVIKDVKMSYSLTIRNGDADFHIYVTCPDGKEDSWYFSDFSENTCREAARRLGLYDPDRPVRIDTEKGGYS